MLFNCGGEGILCDERWSGEVEKVLNMIKNSTILVVDDEHGVRQSFKMVLEEHYRLHFAEDGQTALKIFNQKHIDLVLLDILLPDMDGLVLLKQLKEIEPETEIIAEQSNEEELANNTAPSIWVSFAYFNAALGRIPD